MVGLNVDITGVLNQQLTPLTTLLTSANIKEVNIRIRHCVIGGTGKYGSKYIMFQEHCQSKCQDKKVKVLIPQKKGVSMENKYLS